MSVSNAEVIHWHSAELRADHKCGITSSYQTSAAPQQDGVMGRLLSCLPLGDPTLHPLILNTTRERGKKGGERGGVHHQRQRRRDKLVYHGNRYIGCSLQIASGCL
jgi:hypothetical protein